MKSYYCTSIINASINVAGCFDFVFPREWGENSLNLWINQVFVCNKTKETTDFENALTRMLFASIISLGQDCQLLTLLTSHFQNKQVDSYILIHYWMQMVDPKFMAYWKNQYWDLLSSRRMEFSTLFTVVVLNALMAWWTFGKG